MPKENAYIGSIRNLSRTGEIPTAIPGEKPSKAHTVHFEGDRKGLLDLSAPVSKVWSRVIERLQSENKAVYVEIDPETDIIIKLVIPEISKVGSLFPGEAGNIDVQLIPSAAPHYLLRTNTDFDPMLRILQSALDNKTEILTTTDPDTFEILDVRSFTGSRSPDIPPGPSPVDPPVTEQRAKDLFDLMNSGSCDPCNAAAPCITFKYPNDGCYARAHEMCRMMSLQSEAPEKVWIYSSSDNNLRPDTSNDPNCVVGWRYHVAPTLLVSTSGGDKKMVIDPSLAAGPVLVDDWKSTQNDAGASIEYSGASIYYKSMGDPTGSTDNDYSQTNSALSHFRDLLNIRCAQYGTSPFSCPIVKDCFFIVDRSTISKDEVDAMLSKGGPADIEAAFYFVLDGFAPSELGITPATLVGVPNVAPTFSFLPPVAEMSMDVMPAIGLEDPVHLIRRQRITWNYKITFTGSSGFVNEVGELTLSASIQGYPAAGRIYLIKQPNPYEVDGAVSWLSTDLRVFQIKAGKARFAKTMVADANDFISGVISNLNNGTSGGETFTDISTDQETSWLELSETVGGVRVYNFAVARVRYRALSVPAPDVRVFFRLFPALSVSLDYDRSTTYRQASQAGVVKPLLGIIGGETVTIPCFAGARIDSSAGSMIAQLDTANVQVLPPDAGGNEKVRYFGCWLDFNQGQPQFPLNPSPVDGPYPSGTRMSIQDLVRYQHQCLVAEIAFDPAPVPSGSNPSTSDKLAQRNLAIVQSANPGITGSRRIPHVFEIRRNRTKPEPEGEPDELMIEWGNTPVHSAGRLYIPAADTNEILRLANERYRFHSLVRIDAHTLLFETGGITYIPIPGGNGPNYTAMLTIDLPPTVKKGQVFTIVVHQVTTSAGRPGNITHRSASTSLPVTERRILGTFQITIPVRMKEEMLEHEARLLSNLRWIGQAIPLKNRWYPVFTKYVGQIAVRVDSLGGKSGKVAPSPDGEWQKAHTRCLISGLITALLIASFLVCISVLQGIYIAASAVLLAGLLAACIRFWTQKCRPGLCKLLFALVAGAGTSAIVIAVFMIFGITSPKILIILLASGVLTVAGLVTAWVKGCFSSQEFKF